MDDDDDYYDDLDEEEDEDYDDDDDYGEDEGSHPYRSPSEVPYTDGEVTFWENVYANLIVQYTSKEAAEWAGHAVKQRREKFGPR